MRIFLVLILAIMCFCGSAGAVDILSNDDAANKSVLGILGGSKRATTFTNLKLKRAETMRAITAADARLKELKQEIKLKEEQIKSLEIDLENFRNRKAVENFVDLENKIASLERNKERSQEELEAYKTRRLSGFEMFKTDSGNTPNDIAVKKLEIDSELAAAEADMRSRAKDIDVDIAGIRRSIAEEKIRSDAQKAEDVAQQDRKLAAIDKLNNQIANMYKDTSESSNTIQELTKNLNEIDSEITDLIKQSDSEGSFKIAVSLTFAGLVSFVILGFYVIAGRNKEVVFTIFSNDSGIQFITLFSIVIAVILFGIIGVLEGKELSALLGGLSGYILGRGSNKSQSEEKDSKHPPPPAAATPPTAPQANPVPSPT
jgi:hypothetical protein